MTHMGRTWGIRLVSMVLAAAMALGMVGVSLAEQKQDPTTIRIFRNYSGGVEEGKHWGKDPVSNHIIQASGTTVEWSYPPENNDNALQLMIASDSMADIIIKAPLSIVTDLIAEDRVWAINELDQEFGTNILGNFDKHVLANVRTQFDSENVYMLPWDYINEEYFSNPYLIKNNKGVTMIAEIYEEAGSPEVKTVEDYLNLLREVKKLYPDMIPASSIRSGGVDALGNPSVIRALMPMFGFGISGFGSAMYEQDGKYVRPYVHKNFLPLLKTANTMYHEGLIDKNEFTETSDQIQAKIWGGKVFSEMMQDSDNINWFSRELQKVRPEWSFTAMTPFGMDENTPYACDSFGGGYGTPVLFVSKSSKNPEACAKFLETVFSKEVQKELVFGTEGKGYEMRDGVPYELPEFMEKISVAVDEARDEFGNCVYTVFRDGYWTTIRGYQYMDDSTKLAQEKLNQSYVDLSDAIVPDFEANTLEKKIDIQIKEYYTQEVVKIISGAPELVEENWNKMVSKLYEMSLDKLEAWQNNALSSRKDKLVQYSQVNE